MTPKRCRTCGATLADAPRFCPSCGEILPTAGSAAAVLDGATADTGELRLLAREKARLAADLEALVEQSMVRSLSPEERRHWEQQYTRWRDVASELTDLLDRLHPRSPQERREASPPPPVERRSRDDRRDPFWHRAP